MNEVLSIAKNLLPQLAPVAIKVGKSICAGALCELAFKYAGRICGAHILSQRDLDIKEAWEFHRKYSDAMQDFGAGLKKSTDAATAISEMAIK